MAKKPLRWDRVKTGKDLAQYVTEHGGEIHDSHKGTKAVVPHKGSFTFNFHKELSKPDKSHFGRILKILGLLVFWGITFVALVDIALSFVGYHIDFF